MGAEHAGGFVVDLAVGQDRDLRARYVVLRDELAQVHQAIIVDVVRHVKYERIGQHFQLRPELNPEP
ncbi:hypothetical protein GCM10027200_75760 [Lentzea nigeriaca]